MITDKNRARLDGRRDIDYRVITAMAERCPTLEVEAYASASDLKLRRNRITEPTDGHLAAHYRTTHKIPTLVGPGQFAPETVIRIDAEVAGYPSTPPASWVLTKTPWSPHFRAESICIGQIWEAPENVLLGHMVRHHARLLNWHEIARGGGYVGWNGAAIEYHRKHYGTRPLNDVRYPEIPEDIAFGIASPVAADLFGEGGRQGGAVLLGEMFEGFERSAK